MYSISPSFVLGFHGCERDVGERVLAGEQTLLDSTNDYDCSVVVPIFGKIIRSARSVLRRMHKNAVLSKIRS